MESAMDTSGQTAERSGKRRMIEMESIQLHDGTVLTDPNDIENHRQLSEQKERLRNAESAAIELEKERKRQRQIPDRTDRGANILEKEADALEEKNKADADAGPKRKADADAVA